MILKNRKGISTFIATLLLMVLAVAAGVVIYAYTMGYLGGFGSPQTMGGISVDTWALNPSATSTDVAMTAYIRNIGKTSFIADTVYVNGQQITKANGKPTVLPNANVGWWFDYGTETSLGETKVGTLTITQGAGGYTFLGSTTYDVKIIGRDNTQISFQVKK